MHWVFLTLAIVGEVFGTSVMKFFISAGKPFAGTLIAILAISVSYLLLSQATLRLPVAFANAAWEGMGMVLIAAVSAFWLKEHISLTQVAGIALAVAGIIVVHYGYKHAETPRQV